MFSALPSPSPTPPSDWLYRDAIKETGIHYLEAEQYTAAVGFMSHSNIYKAP